MYKIGFALAKFHELVMTRVCADGDLELAEELNDSLKPVVDFLLHWECVVVRRG